MLNKLKPYVLSNLLTNVYYAIVYPFLLYGIIIWGNSCKYLLNSIHLLQKRFVRIATDNNGSWNHTLHLFHNLNILNIYDIYNLQLALLVYDYKSNNGPINNIINFTNVNAIHQHNTRSALKG